MSNFDANFVDPDKVRNYNEKGPSAFAPGHEGLLQMIGVLLEESLPDSGNILVIGAGGGLETRYLAQFNTGWTFTGVDPSAAMLELARAIAGPIAGDRMTLIEGMTQDAPSGPYDAATCILVLGVLPDDGSKLSVLTEAHKRLKPGAPFILVDQCLDRDDPQFDRKLTRYAEFALRSGVDAKTVEYAKDTVGTAGTMVAPERNEALLTEAGFDKVELFYAAMAWRGWIAYA